MDEEDDDFYAQNGDAQVKSEESVVKNEHDTQDAAMQDEDMNAPPQADRQDDQDDDDEDEEDDDDDDSVCLACLGESVFCTYLTKTSIKGHRYHY